MEPIIKINQLSYKSGYTYLLRDINWEVKQRGTLGGVWLKRQRKNHIAEHDCRV